MKTVILIASLILLTLFLSCHNGSTIDCSTKIEALIVTDLHQDVFWKSQWCINNEWSLHSATFLIENPDSFIDWSHRKPIYEFKDLPHRYAIPDIEPPFIFYKKAHSDTITVMKDSCKLKFQISCL